MFVRAGLGETLSCIMMGGWQSTAGGGLGLHSNDTHFTFYYVCVTTPEYARIHFFQNDLSNIHKFSLGHCAAVPRWHHDATRTVTGAINLESHK